MVFQNRQLCLKLLLIRLRTISDCFNAFFNARPAEFYLLSLEEDKRAVRHPDNASGMGLNGGVRGNPSLSSIKCCDRKKRERRLSPATDNFSVLVTLNRDVRLARPGHREDPVTSREPCRGSPRSGFWRKTVLLQTKPLYVSLQLAFVLKF